MKHPPTRLDRKDLTHNPFAQFDRWYRHAKQALGEEEAQVMTVSTIDLQGFPDGRMILLKEYDSKGFVFYTNLESTKGKSLLKTNRAALTFFWPTLHRQVRIQGTTSLVNTGEADHYFHSRPRISQLGAWASQQSQPLDSRATLEKRVLAMDLLYKGKDVPRPPYWTGIFVKPIAFEFWQAGEYRLHDRFAYIPKGTRWMVTRLYP